MRSHRGSAAFAGVAVIAAVIAVLYLNGRLDPLLYRFGLNHNPCTHTLTGSVACGPNIPGTPFNAGNRGGGGGGGGGGGVAVENGGSAGNPAPAAGSVGKANNGALGSSGGSVP